MPIFGLVWVASWVGCFFPSSRDLLEAPSYIPCATFQESSHRLKPSCTNTCASPVASLVGDTGFVKLRRGQLTRPVAFVPPLISGSRRVQSSAQGGEAGGNSLVQGWKNFLLGLENLTLAQDRHLTITEVGWQHFANQKASQTGFEKQSRRCVLWSNPNPADNPTIFQVKLGDYVVGEAADRRTASKIANRLQRVLRQPSLQPSKLVPGISQGQPAVKLDNQVLFTLDEKVVASHGCNAELLVINWVNNLRLALSSSPLTLPVAQETMHELQETTETISGIASWYGPYFHGRLTATGEIFDQNDFTAAHPTLPFNTFLKVTNLNNGKSLVVRVNDRGPYIDNRTLDLSREAARFLGSEEEGIVPIEAVVMKPEQSVVAVNSPASDLEGRTEGENDVTAFVNQ